jgi:hypothetical protein
MSFEMDRRQFLRLAARTALAAGAAGVLGACSGEGEDEARLKTPVTERTEVQMSEARKKEIVETARNKRQEINDFVETHVPQLAFLIDLSSKLSQQEQHDRDIGVGSNENKDELSRSVSIGKFPAQFPEGENLSATIFYQIAPDGEPKEIIDYVFLHEPGADYYFYPSESNDGRAFTRIDFTENGKRVTRHTGDFNPDVLIESEDFEGAEEDLKGLIVLVDDALEGGRGVIEELQQRLG